MKTDFHFLLKGRPCTLETVEIINAITARIAAGRTLDLQLAERAADFGIVMMPGRTA